MADELNLKADSVNVVFVDDSTLRAMHRQYLDDDTFTDVMTFDLGEENIEGEIYISTDRALAQADEFGVTPEEEVVRLIIHGLLHLKGYDDTTEKLRSEMKQMEDRLVEKYSRSA